MFLILNLFVQSIPKHRVAKEEILALTQMAEQINSKFSAQQQHQQLFQQRNQAQKKNPQQQPQPNNETLPNGNSSANESVDLDNLFAFLSEVTPNGSNGPNAHSNAIIQEIGEKMNNLVDDLDIELESVIQQEIEGLTNERNLMNSHNSNSKQCQSSGKMG